jgi:hypothetical protein
MFQIGVPYSQPFEAFNGADLTTFLFPLPLKYKPKIYLLGVVHRGTMKEALTAYFVTHR